MSKDPLLTIVGARASLAPTVALPSLIAGPMTYSAFSGLRFAADLIYRWLAEKELSDLGGASVIIIGAELARLSAGRYAQMDG